MQKKQALEYSILVVIALKTTGNWINFGIKGSKLPAFMKVFFVEEKKCTLLFFKCGLQLVQM